jgi:hypothetical protein
MSSATHAASGKLSFGGLMSRLVLILVLWAGLVFGVMHYVGHVIPTAYQISQAKEEAAIEEAKALANPEPATPAAPAASAKAAPAAASGSAPAPAAAAPAKTSAAPATAAGSATPAAAPAAGSAAPKGPTKLPKDVLLAGFNRTALTNVAIFYSIVISVLALGVIILQVYFYKHVDEEAAH